MTVFGILVFSFCTWAIFSRHFCDGIVAKHLLAFSAITAALTALDPKNMAAAFWTLVLLVAGLAYWAMKHRALINHRLTELFPVMPFDQEKLEAQLVLEEGKRLMAYDDATGYPVPPGGTCKGKLTVGVGHNLDAKPLTPSEIAVVGHDGRTKPITDDDAMLILSEDISDCAAALDAHLPWWEQLDEIRARVMADLTFNMGIHKLLDFQHFLASMQSGDYDGAADNLKDSAWYNQVHTRGVRLVGMVRTGEDYTA